MDLSVITGFLAAPSESQRPGWASADSRRPSAGHPAVHGEKTMEKPWENS
jgi:hypothetical protein